MIRDVRPLILAYYKSLSHWKIGSNSQGTRDGLKQAGPVYTGELVTHLVDLFITVVSIVLIMFIVIIVTASIHSRHPILHMLTISGLRSYYNCTPSVHLSYPLYAIMFD